MSTKIGAMTDGGFLAWSRTFMLQINLMGTELGFTPAQLTAYTDAHGGYDAALQLATAEATRTRAAVANKSDARDSLEELARRYISHIDAQPNVTTAQRIDLGINVRKTPERINAPEVGPVLDVISMNGHEMKVRLHGSSDLKARPWNAKGANVFTLVAAEPSDDPDAWQFYCTTTQRIVTIDFPQTLTPGTQVYVTAFWYSPRGESSPAGEAVGARINFGTGSTAALKLKKAA